MKKKIYYFSGTHWDREWYQTYQGFRLRLVRVIDEMLDYLEQNDRFGVFHFDGQTIVFEDYLEIRPENEPRLRKLIQDGRIVIGPWYCMPDEFLVSGESFIRNFKHGRDCCRQWGVEPWKVGYVCDIFGHTAQFPQIMEGVGMKGAVVGRGTNEDTTPSFFEWEAPNGSKIPTYKIPDSFGYGSYALSVLGQRARGQEIEPNDPEFETKTREYVDHELSRSDLPVGVIMDGMDHEPLHPYTPEYIAKMQEMYPDYEIVHVNLEQLFDELAESTVSLPNKQGELYESGKGFYGGFIHVLTHVLSSHPSVKRRNDLCQALLEKQLEPALVFWNAHGISYPEGYTKTAWKWLLQNHPHDSICGCSVDRVHNEMDFRFSQVESITEAIEMEAERLYTKGYRRCDLENNQVCILNTVPFSQKGPVELTIPFVPDYPKYFEPFGYEDINAFRLYDQRGNEVPYAIKQIKTNATVLPQGEQTLPADLYTIVCEPELDGLGTTILEVRPCKDPVRFFGTLAGSDANLDNGKIRVTVNQDGTLNLHDYQTGKTYRDLLNLIDDGEIGDGWHSSRPKQDLCISRSRLIRAAVRVSSPVYSELSIQRELVIPKEISRSVYGISRSEESVSLIFNITVGLSSQSDQLDVTLEFENTARDHRLRMGFPMSDMNPWYEANTAYTFVQRACGRNERTADWKEADQLEKPMNGIVLVRDQEQNGLAFVGQYGFHECGVDDKTKTIFVTLYRGFGKVYYDDHLVDAQELRKHSCHFILQPLAPKTTNGMLQRVQDRLQSPAQCFVSRQMQPSSFLKVEGDVAVSAIKLADGDPEAIVIRIYNPSPDKQRASLTVDDRYKQYCLCNLLEDPDSPYHFNENEFSLDLSAYQIVTMKFRKL